jgi:ParB-like chromosome segregation protein Spo0J
MDVQPTGQRMEINAAYAFIKSALEGSTLYRTSLKGDEIVLSFISPQVAERHQAKIAQLAVQTGWRLSVNPQPNQGAILEVARVLMAKAGFSVKKGPSIYPEKSEVSAILLSLPKEEQRADLVEAFERETRFRLNLHVATPQKPVENASRDTIVEIPLKRIQISSYHQSLSLDPVKLGKATERARMMGITPPIRVRRARDGYLLTDGLYRLRAAEVLGLERVPAIVG